MTRLFAGLAVILLPALPAKSQYDKPFSHALHLKLELQCAACHARALSSPKAEDNLLPQATVCQRCHEPGPISEPATMLVTKFNHQLHLNLGKLGPVILAGVRSGNYLSPPAEGLQEALSRADQCTACHRGLENSERVSRTADFPLMADCLVCHSEIEPPFSCEKCHTPGSHLKPASHTRQYLEEHSRRGALKEKESCAVCHGRKFKCLGCH
jgi:hypothetical protein